jgi:hypothetical protein
VSISSREETNITTSDLIREAAINNKIKVYNFRYP